MPDTQITPRYPFLKGPNGRNQGVAVRRERQGEEWKPRVFGDDDGGPLLGRGHVPHLEVRIPLLVMPTHRDQGLAVRRETYGQIPSTMSRHAGPLLPGGQIPNLHPTGLLGV